MDCRIIHVNEKYFDVIGEEQSWLLGLLASDGNISKNVILLAQSGENGLKLIEYVKKILNCDNKIYCRETGYKPSYIICFSSKKIKNILAQYNIIKNKTESYLFPELLDVNLYKSFIRGYFEGDGSIGVYKNKGYNGKNLVASIYGNLKFIEKIRNIVPIKVNISNKKNSQAEIRWNGKNAVLFCEWLYESDQLFKTYKYYIFKNYVDNHVNKFLKFRNIKIQVKQMLKDGIQPMDIARKLNIHYQNIYEWKK